MDFSSFLIASGGGINIEKNIPQRSKTTVLAIGIGGMGIKCLKTLKHLVYSTTTQEHFRFIAIDNNDNDLTVTDKCCNHKLPIDKAEEFFNITCGNNKKNDNSPEQNRKNFIQQSKLFANKMNAVLNNLFSNNRESILQVHIFTGVFGGVSAGIFLDVCYLLRRIVKQFNWTYTVMNGYFFLPDMLIGKNINRDAQMHLQALGYASLKELNFCMHLSDNCSRWQQCYNDDVVSTTDRPVDIPFLISKKDSEQIDEDAAQNYAYDLVSQYILFQMEKQDEYANDSVKKAMNNARDELSHVHNIGVEHFDYYSLGGVCGRIPDSEITAYLAANVFHHHFSAVQNCKPEKIEKAFNDAGVSQNYIIDTMKEGIPLYQIPQKIEKKRWRRKFRKQCRNIPYIEVNGEMEPSYFPPILDCYKTIYFEEAPEIRKQNADNLTGPVLKDFLLNDNLISVQSKILKTIVQYCLDEKKGPYYAMYFLNNKQTNMVSAIDDMIADITKQIQSLQTDCPKEDVLNNALKKARRRWRRKFVDAYLTLFTTFCQCVTDIETLNYSIIVLQTIQRQLKMMNEHYCKPILAYFDAMANAFNDNYVTVKSKAVPEPQGFYKNVVSLNDSHFINKLDRFVTEQLDGSNIVQQCIKTVISNSLPHVKDDENYTCLCKLFAEEIYDKFHYSHFEDYLYPSTNFFTDTITNKSYKKHMLRSYYFSLFQNTKPLFSKQQTAEAERAEILYCYMPDSTRHISEFLNKEVPAAASLKSNDESVLGIINVSFANTICEYRYLEQCREKYIKADIPPIRTYPLGNGTVTVKDIPDFVQK